MKWPFFQSKKHDFPVFVQDYLDQDFLMDARERIADARYSVLDCETTGIDADARIITIGAVKYHEQKIELSGILDIRLPIGINSVEAAVHGELKNERSLISEQESMQQLLTYIENTIIVGHHISFDIRMINSWIGMSYPGFKLKNKVIDTLKLIKRIDPQRIERRVAGHDVLQLDRLCEEYGIEVENRHTALGDAYMTAQLFHRLMAQLEKRGVTKVKQIKS
jgi:DNA polymerase-3 subunit epsilon